MHLFGDRVTLALGNLGDGNCGYTTVTTMRADPNATVDSSLCKRHKKFGESSYRGIPPKLRLEHFADAGERHQIDLENLNRTAIRLEGQPIYKNDRSVISLQKQVPIP